MADPDRFENDLIDQFRQHPVLVGIEGLSDTDFAAVLLQRRFLSLAFTPAYDLAIDLLRDEAIIRVARVILREEYPDGRGNTPSHREDMKIDLLRLGVSRQDLVNTRPTRATLDSIAATMELITNAACHDDGDLRLLTILRFWGEVLVSVEYGELWRRMATRMTVEGKNISRFYYPHHIHDAKAHPLASVSPLASTHSDRLGIRLGELLTDEERIHVFIRTEQDVIELKTAFFDQFTSTDAGIRSPSG